MPVPCFSSRIPRSYLTTRIRLIVHHPGRIVRRERRDELIQLGLRRIVDYPAGASLPIGAGIDHPGLLQ